MPGVDSNAAGVRPRMLRKLVMPDDRDTLWIPTAQLDHNAAPCFFAPIAQTPVLANRRERPSVRNFLEENEHARQNWSIKPRDRR